MAEIRLGKAASEFNVSTQTIIESLQRKGFAIDNKPTAKLTEEMYGYIAGIFSSDKEAKEESKSSGLKLKKREDVVKVEEFFNKKKEEENQIEAEPEPEFFIKNVSSEVIAPLAKEKPAPVNEPAVEVVKSMNLLFLKHLLLILCRKTKLKKQV